MDIVNVSKVTFDNSCKAEVDNISVDKKLVTQQNVCGTNVRDNTAHEVDNISVVNKKLAAHENISGTNVRATTNIHEINANENRVGLSNNAFIAKVILNDSLAGCAQGNVKAF